MDSFFQKKARRYNVSAHLLLITFTLFFGLSCHAGILVKPWDENCAAIHNIVDTDIPQVFQPQGRSISIETITTAEMVSAVHFLDPSDPRDDTGVIGLYLPRPADPNNPQHIPEDGNMIFISSEVSSNPTLLAQVVTHEYGHAVYDGLLNSRDRMNWWHVWLCEHLEQTHPTQYAAYNYGEGFAEEFSLYCLDKSKLSTSALAFFESVRSRLIAEDAIRARMETDMGSISYQTEPEQPFRAKAAALRKTDLI